MHFDIKTKYPIVNTVQNFDSTILSIPFLRRYSMKNKLLALTLLIAAVSFSNINAHENKSEQVDRKIIEKAVHLHLFKASSTKSRLLIGNTSSKYIPLFFTKEIFSFGDEITLKKNHFQFVLEKGTYEIAFTGTFQYMAGPTNLVEIAVKAGSGLFNVNKTSIAPDSFQTLTTNQIIHLSKREDVSIVVRTIVEGSSTAVLQHSIAITKLG